MNTIKNYLNILSALAITLLVSACATDGIHTEEKSAISAAGDAAASLTIRTVTATVKEIDLPSRTVTIVGPEGNAFTLQAGEQVRNLAQVKVGDKVTVEYTDGIAAELVAPGASKDVTVTEAMARAAPGERPAGAAAAAVTAMVIIEQIDTEQNTVQFKNSKGDSHIVVVKKPEFRTMLRNLKPGDQVAITYIEAVAVSVHPASD